MTKRTGTLTAKFLAWSAFDAGNSAHALLVSTVGFALYFKEVLFKDNPRSDSLWAFVTAIVLSLSGMASPFITSWLAHIGRRSLGLWTTTLGCVVATAALGLPLPAWVLVACYVVSALGYYLALPIYNSYLERVSEGRLDDASSRGWAIGYLGGVLVSIFAFGLGLLSKPITERPDLYRWLFVLAAAFNLVMSLPVMVLATKWDGGTGPGEGPRSRWDMRRGLAVFHERAGLTQVLASYWLVGECGTITVYFTAIFLAQYLKMPPGTIFALTLVLQLIGTVTTWTVGSASSAFGSKRMYWLVCGVWAVVPLCLWAISRGATYWIALVAIGLVIGAHHAIVRSEVAKLSRGLSPEEMGSVFGLLEVTGRITSVLGPLCVGVLTLFMPLADALLSATVFPILALLVIAKYRWQDSEYSSSRTSEQPTGI